MWNMCDKAFMFECWMRRKSERAERCSFCEPLFAIEKQNQRKNERKEDEADRVGWQCFIILISAPL